MGVRYATGCHVDDGYICSSESVKPRILRNPSEWKREIVDVGDATEMQTLELEILQLSYNSKDTRCLNRNATNAPPRYQGQDHPSFGKEASEETRAKQSKTRKRLYEDLEFYEKNAERARQEGFKRRGIPTGPHPVDVRNKISDTLKANPQVIAACKARAELQKGKPNIKLGRPVVGISISKDESAKYFISAGEAGRNGFTQSQINNCCSGKRKSHKGYTWRYATKEEILEQFNEHAEILLSRN